MITRRSLIASLPILIAPRFTRVAAGAPALRQGRAIFCDGPLWVGERNAGTVCQRTKAAGFNTLIVCPWQGRGVTWPSQVSPEWSNHPIFIRNHRPGMDPFRILLDTAHRQGLQVHACFTIMARRRDFHPQFHPADGWPKNRKPLFDAHNPAFRLFITDLMQEFIDKYEIDGLSLDYIRSGAHFWKNDDWNNKYRLETGREGLQSDWRLLSREAKIGVPAPDAHALNRWQEAAVGEIVRNISAALKHRRPETVLGAFGYLYRPDLLAQGQDLPKWLAEGDLDIIFQMDYRRRPDWAAHKANQSKLKYPDSLVITCGNYETNDVPKDVTPRNGQIVSDLITQAKTINANGVALYLYNQLSDGQITALSNDTFEDAATPIWPRHR